MGNLVAVEASNLLNASLGLASFAAPTTPMKLALITTATPSTATAAGSEVSGGSYARVSLTSTTVMSTSSAGSNSTNASGSINFTNMPGSTTVGGVEIWDNTPTTPVRKWFGTLAANKTTNSGDTLSFATSALSVGLS